MKIAFDARSLASPVLRGWDRYAVGLARALGAQGVEVVLLCRARAPVHGPHAAAARAAVLPLEDRGGLWWEQVALPLALRQHRFALYHAVAEHGVPFLAPCPVVLTIHSATAHSYADFIARGLLPGGIADYLGADLDPSRPSPANLYWHAQTGRAAHVLAPSEFAREEIVRLVGLPAGRVTVTPLAADDSFRAAPSEPAARAATLRRLGIRPPYLLYVGGFEPHKNVRGTVAAFELARRARPDLSLVLVGSRPDAAFDLSTLNLQPSTLDRLTILHGVTPELLDLYDGAELLLNLSWRESFGLPALEAMTRGVAPVVSLWGASREVVGDGGALVDPRDPQAAAVAIGRLLGVPRTERAARARAAAARFTWDDTVARTRAVYRGVS